MRHETNFPPQQSQRIQMQNRKLQEQARAELSQAQVELEVIDQVVIEVKKTFKPFPSIKVEIIELNLCPFLKYPMVIINDFGKISGYYILQKAACEAS